MGCGCIVGSYKFPTKIYPHYCMHCGKNDVHRSEHCPNKPHSMRKRKKSKRR